MGMQENKFLVDVGDQIIRKKEGNRVMIE